MLAAKLNVHRSGGITLGLAVCLLAACSSSPQMSRIDANREIYEQWPIEVRQAVLDGKVEEGMTPEMVTMAIGKPTEVSTRSGTPATGDDEVWIYRTGGEQESGPIMPGAGYPGNYPAGYPGVYPGGGGIVMAPGRGGGVAVMPPPIGIGIGGGGVMGGGMPVSRSPVQEREVVFRNGVVLHADPPPEK